MRSFAVAIRPSALVAPIHDRMPVILPSAACGEEAASEEEPRALLAVYPAALMPAYRPGQAFASRSAARVPRRRPRPIVIEFRQRIVSVLALKMNRPSTDATLASQNETDPLNQTTRIRADAAGGLIDCACAPHHSVAFLRGFAALRKPARGRLAASW